MNEQDLRDALQNAVENCQLSGYQKQNLILHTKGEEPVKKKITLSLAFILTLTLLTIGVAGALVHSTIADHLFGRTAEVPKEVSELIQTPQASTNTELGCLSLNE